MCSTVKHIHNVCIQELGLYQDDYVDDTNVMQPIQKLCFIASWMRTHHTKQSTVTGKYVNCRMGQIDPQHVSKKPEVKQW